MAENEGEGEGEVEAVSALAEAVRSRWQSYRVRVMAIQALGKIGPKAAAAVPALAATLNDDEDRGVRDAAKRALARIVATPKLD